MNPLIQLPLGPLRIIQIHEFCGKVEKPLFNSSNFYSFFLVLKNKIFISYTYCKLKMKKNSTREFISAIRYSFCSSNCFWRSSINLKDTTFNIEVAKVSKKNIADSLFRAIQTSFYIDSLYINLKIYTQIIV